MTLRALAIALAMAASIHIGSVARAAERSLQELINSARAANQSICDRSQADLKRLHGAHQIQARIIHMSACECMPSRLATLERLDGTENGDMELIAELVAPQAAACTAIAKRRHFADWCAMAESAHAGVIRVDEFCRCMLEGMSRFTDEQLAANAVAAERSHLARLKARSSGAPEPPPMETFERSVERACRAQDKAPTGSKSR